mgnify:CR=1 FL=1
MTREKMIEELVLGICEVNFTKKNGDLREMACTLSSYHIPEDKKPKSDNQKEKNTDIIPVWDMRKEEWRSFRVDSVISFERLTESPMT